MISFRKIEKLLLSFLLIAVFVLPTVEVNAQNDVPLNTDKFGRLLRLVDGYYVDTANVNALTEKAIVNLLSDLDPHSTYISKEEVKLEISPAVNCF